MCQVLGHPVYFINNVVLLPYFNNRKQRTFFVYRQHQCLERDCLAHIANLSSMEMFDVGSMLGASIV